MKKLLLLLCLCLSATINAQNYQYLGSYSANGVPDYLEPIGDTVDVATLEMISSSLPESYPVPDYNPHYISSGYDTDLIIDDLADVWVTFVSEGAGYKNVLGFYTYDVNNPPATAPQPEDITIIFPNVSALGSGGGLVVGDKVKIGTFQPGTGIGWVLLANAWSSSSSSVGNGLWQLFSNPDYNPEAHENLRHHNVLLNDPNNERIILGFEDIRRDYSSCDNDFNDAIFYVSANPYEALRTTNYADVSSATDVSSANDGGLESNGNLAGLIAKRNFKRTKTGQVQNRKVQQAPFIKQQIQYRSSTNTPTLESYLPETGMYGTETAYVSSPEDLLSVTNASEIFSVDFYKEETRVSAVLATATEGSIYDHSKVICDRLNSSSLEDVRTVTVRGHQIISSKIKRVTGETEFTLSFSVKLGDAANELYSFWNIAQYPEGDYYNFQIWGSSFSQVFSIGNHIIDTLTAEKPLNSETLSDVVPPVFVSSGYYSNGALHLNIINKVSASSFTFNGSIAATEVSDRTNMTQAVSLNGDWNDSVSIQTGSLFDIGFSLTTSASTQQDALYLADGPWGVDYLEEYATVDTFFVDNQAIDYTDDAYEVERQPMVSGQVKGNVNLFRHVLPGDQTLDVTEYSALKFNITNNMPIEIVLMQENLQDWNNRFRYTIPENQNETTYTISFSDFVDGNGVSATINDVKTIVFSVIGDYASYAPFSIGVNGLEFRQEAETLDLDTYEEETLNNTVTAIPNPMTVNTSIQFMANQNETVQFVMYNQLGKQVYYMNSNVSQGKNVININRNNLSSGLYFCKVISKTQTYDTLKLLIK
ncbi:DUF4114 domain-containing protein [Gaetbulibacter sp. NE]|uniref:DUF4114 domain-containing protein n=1 Tax=Gaetbulibacter sp. NE TaxID=2982307 RepID=UPI0021D26E91|nr:DUF4114 domain-containing protein [Gaetbulibacter sp. NE]